MNDIELNKHLSKKIVKRLLKKQPQVKLGVDGGQGHVHRNDPIRIFRLDSEGQTLVVGAFYGLNWSNEVRLAIDTDFQHPNYGVKWIR